MELGLKGKVVLVTGASRGIGFAAARAFAREGAKIVMSARSPEKLQASAQTLRDEYGAQVDTLAGDLTDESFCERLVMHTHETFGRIDVLVNNASGKLPIGNFLTMKNEEWLSGWTNKMQVYVTLCRLVLPFMQQQQGGRIICVLGAHAARNPTPSVLPVGAVTAGLVNFVKGLADLGAPHNILVTGVSPSGVDTGRWEEWQQRQATALNKDLASDSGFPDYAIKRPARPEEVGDVICFMASERTSYISGVVLTVDGNLTRGVFL